MTPRRGYVGLPREALREAGRELEPVQGWLLVQILAECNIAPGAVDLVCGGAVLLDVGEALLSTRSFAERHRVTRDQVRRFLDRLVALGWISRRQAAPPPAPGAAPPPAPPPTIVRVEKWRGILWPERTPAPPPAPGAAPPPAPIQQDQTPLPLEQRESAAAPRPPSRRKRRAVEVTPAALALLRVARLEYQQLRGVPYAQASDAACEADLEAACALARAAEGDLEEFAIRWRTALVHTGWPRIDSLAELAQHWPKFSPSPAEAKARLRLLHGGSA